MKAAEQHSKDSVEQRKQEKREALINAAFRVFSHEGYASATIDMVAEEAKVAKGTVYLYFDSKERLFQAMVEAKLLPVVQNLPFPESSKASDILRQQVRFIYREIVGDERRKIIRLIVSEAEKFPELAEFYYKTILSRGMAGFSRIVEYGQQTGEFDPDFDTSFPMMLMAPAIMAGLWKLVFDPFHPVDLDAYCEAHIQQLLNTLSVKPVND